MVDLIKGEGSLPFLKVLIIAPSWVGDMVMTQALLRLIKKRHPNCSIDVFAKPLLHPLLQRMPEVDHCLTSTLQGGDIKIFERFKLGRSMRRYGYTYAYVIPNSFKSALVPFFAGISTRVGWCGEWRYFLLNDLRILDEKKLPAMVERFVVLGCEKDEALPPSLPRPELKISAENLLLILARLKISLPTRPILAICPGSEQQKKCWPASYYAEIAMAKKAEGWDVWIFGGIKEQNFARIIQEHCHGLCVDLTGKTDLGEAADLLSLVAVVVANDSGLMHVASALNKPVVAIYGPTMPEVAPPLTKNKFKILSLRLPCSPCKGRCLLGHKCLYDLRSNLVLQAIKEVIV